MLGPMSSPLALIAMLLAMLSLVGCGMDTASTAATAAAVKKQEIRQGQATQAQVQDALQKALQATDKRAEPATQGSP